MKNILQKVLLLRYEFEEPGKSVFFNTVLLFLCLNVLFSFSYWFSLITGQVIDIGVWKIDVPEAYPVKYFSENITRVLLISFPVSLAFWFIQVFKTKNLIFYPLDNTVKNIRDSVIKPPKYSYKFLEIKVIGFLLFKLAVSLFLLFFCSWAVYYKLYNSNWYNKFYDWKSQEITTLLGWNLVFLLAFLLSFFLFLEGISQLSDIRRKKQYFFKKLRNKNSGEL